SQPFFHKLVEDLVAVMGQAYPELVKARREVAAMLKAEELRFADTLEHGMKILDVALAREGGLIDGGTVFTLYDTYGFPVDLTADVARERGKSIDMAGYEAAMEAQRAKARAASKFQMAAGVEYAGAKTEFRGHDALRLEEAKVLALYRDGTAVTSLAEGEAGIVVLDRTPFYAESGGQVGDVGELTAANAVFRVSDTQKIQADVFGHHGTLARSRLSVFDTVTALVDIRARHRAAWNHSATHLMHTALRRVLGHHVQQKGSLVDPQRTRFDFSHGKPMHADEIRAVEDLVNREIRANHPVSARVMKYDEAIKAGAMALFGEKYGDEVRVIGMGDFSTELCGGTHVRHTGDIGFFKVVSESGVAAGVRRIEAVTADGALAWVQSREEELARAAHVLKAQPGELTHRIEQVLENVKSLERELARLKSKMASAQGEDIAAGAVEVKGARVLAARLEGADAKILRETLDRLKDRLQSAAIVLASVEGERVTLIAGVTEDLTGKVKAGELANFVARQVGGKGGGRVDMAQAGGTNAAALPQALASVAGWVCGKL
ncbi:MAG: alanine--tRNA ligase, partial [Betaproteobacteria bacterium]|nr:alanine--tRNA ligase [Betaproteobacteria bacterium]